MKKLLIAILLLGLVITFGGSKAYAFDLTGLASFGSLVSLPISAPTSINIMGGTPIILKTTGSVDFAVLYNSGTSLYSYFYQVTNNDGGVNDAIGRFTVDNNGSHPLLGYGVINDGLDPVQLITNKSNLFGADLDDLGNNLQVGQTTNRFYFQFKDEPTVTDGYLIDGGIGTGKVIGPTIPEPSSLMLLGMGILGLFGLGKKKA